jgi:hypothetical protein
MAQIRDNPVADGLAVQAASKAAHARLMDDNNRPLAKLSTDLLDATTRGLLGMGVTPSTNQINPMQLDATGRVRLSQITTLVSDSFFSNTTLNPAIWQILQTTMTATQSSVTGLILNSGASAAVSAGYALKSNRRMVKRPGEALFFRESARIAKVNNTVAEIGFADGGAQLGVTPTALLDQSAGAYWRFTASGGLVPVISYNNTDVQFGTNVTVQPNQIDYYDYVVIVEDLGYRFAIYSKLGAVVNEQFIPMPVGLPKELGQISFSAFVGLRNLGTAPASAPRMDIGYIGAGKLNSADAYTAAEASAFLGNSVSISPNGLSQTLVNVTSGTGPTAVTLTNTTSVMGNTLGGRGLYNVLAGGETDYGLCSLINTDSVGAGMTFMCTGYRIEIGVGVTPIATTPTVVEPFLFVGDSNNPASALARKYPLGSMYMPIGMVVGDSRFMDVDFPAKALLPNRAMGIGLRIPIATATAGQTFRTNVTPKGYWAV